MRALPILLLVAALAAGAGAAQAQGEPGPPHPTKLELGALPPTGLALESVNDEVYDIATAREEGQPLLLLFFRGTW